MSRINEYYEALERLKKNKPVNVPVGTKIGNDAVALEAGRKRGSIKKSREVFHDLIEKIDEEKEKVPILENKVLVDKYKLKAKDYKILYFDALNRELMLIERINELEKELQKPRLRMNSTYSE